MQNFNILLNQIAQPGSGIPTPSHTYILIKYCIANICLRLGEMDKAVALSTQILKIDIPQYFGHNQIELSLEPMLIILNHRFDLLCRELGERVTSEEELATFIEEVQGLAEQAKNHIIAIQGHQSEKLIEIYCLYSFFAFHRQDFEQGMAFQEMAT